MSLFDIIEDVVLALLTWVWLVFCLGFVTRLGRLGKILTGIVLGLVTASAFLGMILAGILDPTKHRWVYIASNTEVASLFYAGMTSAVVLVVGIIVRVFRYKPNASVEEDDQRPGGQVGKPLSVRIVRTLAVIVVALSLVTTGFGYVNALRVSLPDVTITNSRLPQAFDGVRIALITDIHLGATIDGNRVRRIVEEVNLSKPDLIVIDGDIMDGFVAQLGPEVSQLGELHAPYGVVVTTGNHEFKYKSDELMKYLSGLGLTVLDNDAIILRRDSSSIAILGINDRKGTGAHKPNLQLASDRLNSALGGDDVDIFKILIAHEPIQAKANDNQAAALGIDLQLSGHTHGGQMWPLNLVSKVTRGTSSGLQDIGGVTVFTSKGIGTSGPPVRVGADPEIPIITLKTGS